MITSMMRPWAAVAMLLLLAWGGPAPATDETAFVGVTLVPMDSPETRAGATVLVSGGKITRIGPAAQVEPPEGFRVIPGQGLYLAPGLAEMHAHVPGRSARQGWLDDVLFLYAANGITTARGMLGQAYHLELRDRVARQEVLGPRIVTSGPSVNGNSVDSPEAGARMVAEQARAGYDFVKLHPGLSSPEYEAVAAAAKKHGIPFAGHVSADVGLAGSLSAGQATIDHLDGYMQALVPAGVERPADDGFFGSALAPLADPSRIPVLARETRTAGVWNVPTQTLIENIALPESAETLAARPEMRYVPRDMLARWIAAKNRVLESPQYDAEAARLFVDLRRRLIGSLNEEGAGLLLGSDAPQVFNVPGFSIHRELHAMVASGLTPYEALRAGTANPAEYLGAAGRFGTLAEGADADMVLVTGNPLDDLSVLGRPLGVMLRGRWLSREEIDRGLADIATRYAE